MPRRIERAISIKQPFVEQILTGKKRLEFRSRATKIRERVYLYASLTERHEVAEWQKVSKKPGTLVTGMIVGTVEITDCIQRGTGFAYVLDRPRRLRTPLKATNRAQPCFWRPRF
jgi:predicted transcriptional regulator